MSLHYYCFTVSTVFFLIFILTNFKHLGTFFSERPGRVILILIQSFKHDVPSGFLIQLQFCTQKCFVFDFRPFLGVLSVFGTSKITRVPPFGDKLEKNVKLLIKMAQKKGFNELNAPQKLLLSAKYCFWKNQGTFLS